MAMNSILYGTKANPTRKGEDDIKREADLIVTAVILGFVGTRYYQNQPFSFDYEFPSPIQKKHFDLIEQALRNRRNKTSVEKRPAIDYSDLEEKDFEGLDIRFGRQGDYENVNELRKKFEEFVQEVGAFEHVMSAMSIVLDQTDPKIKSALKAEQSAEGGAGALITGRAGGAASNPNDRHRNITSKQARRMAEAVAKTPGALYQGRGAYTGMIDDPVNDSYFVRPTIRVIDTNETRWHPGEGHPNWGLIAPPKAKEINLSTNPKEGMGPLPNNPIQPKERIGYIHGMCSAIEASIDNGPWCTPFELATGEATTKMASCFACTTYMYAAGYPPSSTHLGRGESWVPPSKNYSVGTTSGIDFEDMDEYKPEIIDSVASRWHYEIFAYMLLGVRYLDNASKRKNLVSPQHGNLIDVLKQRLDEYTAESNTDKDVFKHGGNLFLDALTVHESDWKRVALTLKPALENLTEVIIESEQERVRELTQFYKSVQGSINSFVETI